MKTATPTADALITVNIPGDLTSTSAEKIRATLAPLLEEATARTHAWRTLRLDLRAAKMVDSVGLNLIVTALRAIQPSGARMQIVYGNPNVHRTFLFTRLDKHLELLPG